MNKQWNKDGLTRKKLENDFRIHEPFQVLEKNLSNLLARAFSKSSSLYHYQSLAIQIQSGSNRVSFCGKMRTHRKVTEKSPI